MVGEVIYKIDNKLCFIEGCSDAHDAEHSFDERKKRRDNKIFKSCICQDKDPKVIIETLAT